MTTYDYIIKKYNIDIGRRYIVDIPNMGRDNLAELFAELNFKIGAEIGVEEGEYSETLCKANPQAKIFSIDPWRTDVYEPNTYVNETQEYFDKRYELTVKRLAPYKNCTIVRKASLEALEDFEDNSLDFVYIDANHDFPNIIQDVHGWKKKVKLGGILSGHDYAYFSYSKFNHVKRALEAYTRCYSMIPFFIVGDFEVRKGEIRDKYRSWFWVKSDERSMLGKWDNQYEGVKNMGGRGDTMTYKLAADFLTGMVAVEDWGGGTGGFKRFYDGKCINIDGSATPFVDKIADLRIYKSNIDGIIMRHVLEHNYDWKDILVNAISSFKKKFCLILFTPFSKTTHEIAHNRKHGIDVPDISFNKKDIEQFFKGLKWTLKENIKTRTGYGVEHIYYIER